MVTLNPKPHYGNLYTHYGNLSLSSLTATRDHAKAPNLHGPAAPDLTITTITIISITITIISITITIISITVTIISITIIVISIMGVIWEVILGEWKRKWNLLRVM